LVGRRGDAELCTEPAFDVRSLAVMRGIDVVVVVSVIEPDSVPDAAV